MLQHRAPPPPAPKWRPQRSACLGDTEPAPPSLTSFWSPAHAQLGGARVPRRVSLEPWNFEPMLSGRWFPQCNIYRNKNGFDCKRG